MRYVIIGNGAAGVTAAETIREHDAQGEIVVVSAEPLPMYSRPGLAYVLTNDIPLKRVLARKASWYTERDIRLVYACAERLDTHNQTIFLDSGHALKYDRLLIATGARAVPAAFPGHDLQGIVYLDTYAGVKQLLREARRARRGVVVGGGITAMELAEGLASQHVDTHYFVRRDRLWSRVLNDAESAIIEHHIQRHGITLHYHTEIDAARGNWRGRVREVQLTNGNAFACDIVGVAIGVRPQLELAASGQLATDRAILVDDTLATSAANVFAAGDCAQVYDRWTQRHLVDILWPSAVAQGRCAGLNMAGQHVPYAKGVPFNAALLFGVHITAIGQVNPRPEEGDGLQQSQHWSRGSSDVWFTFPRHYRSAWSGKGEHSIRVTLDGDTIVGALVVGEQKSADALRYLIENNVNAAPLMPYLDADREALQHAILHLWQTAQTRSEAFG